MSRIAIVTGSSGGIGSEVCLALSGNGYQVLGLDSVDSKHVETVLCDLSLENFTSKIGRLDFGRVSLIVHCAAHQPAGDIARLSTDDWELAFRVNVLALQRLVSHYLEDLRQSGGSVVAISSIHGRQTSPKMAAYAASKSALDSWVRSAAIEYGPEIAVVGLSLGAVDTPKLREGLRRWPDNERKFITQRLISKTPMGRLGSASEVAEWVLFLSSASARFASGSILSVDGGVSAWLGSE